MTRWLMSRVDVRTVKDLLGHADISTTMRYAGYVSRHAVRGIREAQSVEEMELKQAKNRQQKG